MVESDNILIDCTNVSKQFGYFFALKRVSVKIRENLTVGIAGANGAGKTTLIKILSGLLSPSIGEVVIGGMNYTDHSDFLKQNIGIISDESFLYQELTIYENLKFYDNLHLNFNKKQIRAKIDRFARIFNLTDWIDEPVRNLSHGMKQKVELMRILIHHPSILFLDEPFTGLDVNATKILIDFLKELKKKENITIVLTTHNIDLLQQICDELIILKRGKLNSLISKENFDKIEIESYF